MDQKEKEKMKRFIRGNDKGNAVLLSLVLILTLSLLFLSLMPRIIAINKYSHAYKERILQAIQNTNKEIIARYDLN